MFRTSLGCLLVPYTRERRGGGGELKIKETQLLGSTRPTMVENSIIIFQYSAKRLYAWLLKNASRGNGLPKDEVDALMLRASLPSLHVLLYADDRWTLRHSTSSSPKQTRRLSPCVSKWPTDSNEKIFVELAARRPNE